MSISKRLLSPGPAPPRVTNSTARASGSFSTQSHQRSPPSRSAATISALEEASIFRWSEVRRRTPGNQNLPSRCAFAPRECEDRTTSSKPCEEGFRARNGYRASGGSRTALQVCPRQSQWCSCGRRAYYPRDAWVRIDSLVSLLLVRLIRDGLLRLC